MKKCYFIFGLILSTSIANAAVDKNYGKLVKDQVKTACINFFNEDGPVSNQEKMKDFCNKVANCVVNHAPNNFSLNDSRYMELAFLQCASNEAEKL